MSEETGWRNVRSDFRRGPGSPERRPTSDIPEIYEFGPFRLEPAERKLLRGNELIGLTPKAFDTLLLLVRNGGHLLQKDELVRQLWPGSFVEEGNLTNSIFMLRRALGHDPEYIETVPKKGYRFVGAVRRLPGAEPVRSEETRSSVAQQQPVSLEPTRGRKTTGRLAITTLSLLVLAGLVYVGIDKMRSKQETPPPRPAAVSPSSAAAAFSPPRHSIAVLPFVNLSGDPRQEYFSDGLTEELLTSLARINELQVAARTSSFYFKGEHADLATIAHKLNVASVLEGSVRRAGNKVRVTAQLNDAVTGFHLWSQTYDRDLRDVLQLQMEIASAVASALKVTLLGDFAARVGQGGTRNPAAFDAYLRASKAYDAQKNGKDVQAAIAEFTNAIREDPEFALAYARRSIADALYARNYADRRTRGEYLDKTQSDARKAIALAPDLAEGHVGLARFFAESLQFAPANEEYERALALAPGNARILSYYGVFAVMMGRTEAGLSAARRAVVLDPLNAFAYLALGYALNIAGRYGDAVAVLAHGRSLDPSLRYINAQLAFVYYMAGDYQNSLAACRLADEANKQICLACIYEKTGRHADAQAILARMRTDCADDCALGYAYIYLEWGDRAHALDWLEKAMRLRDPYLVYLKADRELDPLRNEPRFQAIERRLNFPE